MPFFRQRESPIADGLYITVRSKEGLVSASRCRKIDQKDSEYNQLVRIVSGRPLIGVVVGLL
jgi:hypothetical protein